VWPVYPDLGHPTLLTKAVPGSGRSLGIVMCGAITRIDEQRALTGRYWRTVFNERSSTVVGFNINTSLGLLIGDSAWTGSVSASYMRQALAQVRRMTAMHREG
jgi:hypothetical protein